MLFNSIDFLLFFPLTLAGYFFIPRAARRPWLLVASYLFYAGWDARYLPLMMAITISTYIGGIRLEDEAAGENQGTGSGTKDPRLSDEAAGENQGSGSGTKDPRLSDEAAGEGRTRRKKLIAALSVLLPLGLLAFFKYSAFIGENAAVLLGLFGIATPGFSTDIALPVGISFYTLQAVGYIVDVYRGDVKAERNIATYALFIAFFPQLVAGPIERSKNLLAQIRLIHTKDLFDYHRVRGGLFLMLWGYFLKMVFADRMAIFVDGVFSDYYILGAAELALAAAGFSLQICADFMGYSTIALGAARIMGFSLTENFDSPYFSYSIKDFWRRWHISLSSWLRDYVYIPLGGNRLGARRRYVNLMATFLLSGLWHGASWSFVAWGAVHGVFVILEDATAAMRERILARLAVRTDTFSWSLLKVSYTFIAATFAWIIFRSQSLKDALYYIERFVTRFDPWSLFDGSLFTPGLGSVGVAPDPWASFDGPTSAAGFDHAEVLILAFAVLFISFHEYVRWQYGWDVSEFLERQNAWFRIAWALAVFMAVLIFGEYGAGAGAHQFIYFQF